VTVPVGVTTAGVAAPAARVVVVEGTAVAWADVVLVVAEDAALVAAVLVVAAVVQADLYVSGGIRGTHQWYAIARAFQKPTAMHSGREIGIAQMAKMHVVAAQPDITNATDGIYHQYVDDILDGGLLTYDNGKIALPERPGLGVELDEERLARWVLTDQVHRELDAFWAETKQAQGIGLFNADNRVRRF
jgi:L-alanine-DL-glutamate epimerase-like enolase superfamily enzyme